MTSGRPTCPLCRAPDAVTVVELPDLPVHCSLLHGSAEDARGCGRGDLVLAWCPACSVLWNMRFDPERIAYGEGYESALDHSPTFRDYADRLARRLAPLAGGAGGRILEIGCGNGEFLRRMQRETGADAVGVDPSGPVAAPAGLRILRDPDAWPAEAAGSDLVVFRHVLEHVASPLDFLARLRGALEGRPGAAVYCEVPNGAYLVAAGFLWDVIYEHVFYFTPLALRRLFRAAGFAVRSIEEAFGRQFLGLIAEPDGRPAAGPFPAQEVGEDVRSAVLAFGKAYGTAVPAWRERCRRWRLDGRRVVLWGAGSKGATFLNLVDPGGGAIACAVDVNPRKQGHFIPGTGHRIVAPELLAEIDPHIVLVTNPVYREEIGRFVAGLGISARLVAVGADPAENGP